MHHLVENLFHPFGIIRQSIHFTTELKYAFSERPVYTLSGMVGGTNQAMPAPWGVSPGQPWLQPPICDRFPFDRNHCPFGTAGYPPYPL